MEKIQILVIRICFKVCVRRNEAARTQALFFKTSFLIGIVLNTGFAAAGAVYGILANSLALLADAGHNLSDVLGLALAWEAATAARHGRAAAPQYVLAL